MYKTRLLKPVICILALLLLSIPAFTQTTEELLDMSLEDLLDIKVTTASKKAENVHDAPGIITVISRQEIDGFAAQNLGQVLNRVVSAYLISANVWSDNLVFFRGQAMTPYNNHTLILLNGRPVRDPISGGLNSPVFAAFPVEVIDHIEVIRGPGSVLYGSCAYSGVINIITRDLKENGHETGFHAMYGTYNTMKGTVSGLVKKGDFSATVAVSGLTDDGPEYSFVDYNGVDSSAYFDRNTLGLMANLNYKNIHFNTYYSHFDPYGLSGSQNAFTNQDPHSSVRQKAFFADGGINLLINDKMNADVNITYNYHYIDQEDGTEMTAVDYLGEATFFYHPNEKTNIVVGGIVEKDDYAGERFIDGNTSSMSLYTQADIRVVPAVKVIGGVQYNKIENLDGNFSPRIGLVANVTKTLGFKGLYSTAFRKAYPLETSFNHPVFRGNLDISPELIATAELQVFIQTEKFQSSVTYFNSHMSDIIIRRAIPDATIQPPLPPFYLKYFNGGTHDWWGFEFEEKYSASKNLLITGNLSYQKNKNEDGVENAALHPNLMVKLGLLYHTGKMSVGVYNSYFGKPHEVSILNPGVNNANPMPEAYNLLSAKFTYKILKQLKVSVSGDNLLNKYVRYPEYTSRGVNSLIPLWRGRIVYGTVSVIL